MDKVVTTSEFKAILNLLTPDECLHLHSCIRNEEMDQKGKDSLKKIVDAVSDYNDSVTKFQINTNLPQVNLYDAYEGESKITLVPDHAIHTKNILQDPIWKITAILNVSSRDDVQGGELTFKNWAPPARVDNFGAVISEGADSQPQWTNEQGALIIYPSLEQNGYQLVTSGPIRRLKIHFKGPKFV